MLEDEEMLPIFRQLIGLAPEKPFECVGSRDEANAAAARTIRCLELDEEPIPLLLRYYQTTLLCEQYAATADLYMRYFDTNHQLPPDIERLLKIRCCGG
jgi:hypothetical protein